MQRNTEAASGRRRTGQVHVGVGHCDMGYCTSRSLRGEQVEGKVGREARTDPRATRAMPLARLIDALRSMGREAITIVHILSALCQGESTSSSSARILEFRWR